MDTFFEQTLDDEEHLHRDIAGFYISFEKFRMLWKEK